MADEGKPTDNNEVPAQTFMHRMSICGTCEHMKRGITSSRCKLCGCVLALKTRKKSEKCPIHKW
jgi:hypothetical protein